MTTTTPETDTPTQTFGDFGLRSDIVSSLKEAGIMAPFPIQAMTLPLALAGNDVIGQAKTGTGKTLGFGLPLLHNVVGPSEDGFDDLADPGKPQALVIVPTRELATQVSGDLQTASKHRSVRVLTIYGGRAYEGQVDKLNKGIEVVVGTPGRLLDLAKQKKLDLGHVRCLVLDEADEMLDLGFLPDVESILKFTPAGRQTMLFSATMPGPVVSMARNYMTQPTHIRAADPGDDSKTVEQVAQFVYRAHSMDKVELLARVLQAKDRGLTIVFSRTKRTAAKVADELASRGFASAAIHGDLGQGAREQALRAFRKGKVDVLIATDVAARGIDIDDVTHVVNYQCPEDEKTFLHRVGRTGRAGRSGVAITLVDWDDMHRWKLVDQALELGIPEPAETYSTSEHIFSDLDIPTEATGTLPKAQRTRDGLDAEEIEDLDGPGKKNRSGGGRGPRRGRGSGRDGGQGRSRSGGSRRRSGRSDDGAAQPAKARSGDATSGSDGAESAASKPRRKRTRRRRIITPSDDA